MAPIEGAEERPARSRIDSLTSFRFVASALIVVHHTKWFFPFLEPMARVVPLDIGVSFFYTLSGFILFYSYPSLNDTRSRVRFLVLRIARIWPLHLFMLVMTVICLGHQLSYPVGPSFLDALAIVFLLQAWVPFQSAIFGINGVSWSLSVELFFYAMFPFLIQNFSRTWWWKLLLIVGTVAGILYLVTITHLPDMVWGQNRVTSSAFAFIFPPSRLLEFFLGICTCAVFKRVESVAHLRSWKWTIIEVAALAVTFFAMRHVYPLGFLMQQFGLGSATEKWIDECGCGPAFCLLIFTFALSDGYLNKLISNFILVFLGEISFSTYMIHVPLFTLMRSRLFHSPTGSHLEALVYFCTLIACSAASWRFVEKRGRKFIVSSYEARATHWTRKAA